MICIQLIVPDVELKKTKNIKVHLLKWNLAMAVKVCKQKTICSGAWTEIFTPHDFIKLELY